MYLSQLGSGNQPKVIEIVVLVDTQGHQVCQHSGGLQWTSEACRFWLGKRGTILSF